jgi:hypothetical protein
VNPTETREWLELLRTNPFLLVAIVWGIVEARRFARELVAHVARVERKLDELTAAIERSTARHTH